MLELTALEWFTIGDRQAVTCELLPEFPTRGEIPEDVLKRGDVVHINGSPWRVKGIEYFMSNPPKLGPALGMIVEKAELRATPFSASELNKLDEDMSWYDDSETPDWVYGEDR